MNPALKNLTPYSGRRFVIVVGAGTGSRLGGDVPKAFVKVRGQTLIALSLQAALASQRIAACVGVIPVGWEQIAAKELLPQDIPVSFIEGDATRNGSVKRGLAELITRYKLIDSDIIAIHDAARCLATTDLFERCFEEAELSGAATAACAIRDTLKKGSGEADIQAGAAIDRAGVFAMHTPQVFRFELLQRALSLKNADEATDEVSLVQQIAPVNLVASPISNLKVTFPEDIEIAEALMGLNSVNINK